MNIATILISVLLIVLFGLAVRFLMRHGSCAACEARGYCRKAEKGSGCPEGRPNPVQKAAAVKH